VSSVERKDVTAVPAELVDRVLAQPWDFLRAAMEAKPGWAERYGGAEGVAQLTSVLLADLASTAKAAGEVRTLAVNYLRTNQRKTLAEIGETLGGITPQAVRKIAIRDEPISVFERLRSPNSWS